MNFSLRTVNEQNTVQAGAIARLVRDACLLEIRALKPGNVGLHGDGHGMTAEHFIKSAHAMAEPLCAAELALGERILRAIKATQLAVGCNTNLGIVLLAAPIVHAAWRVLASPKSISLREALHEILLETNQQDAALAYEAIRLASPGGLGNVAHHDVREAPSITLQQCMHEASKRDAIAMEYCNDYARVFTIGVSSFAFSASNGMSDEWAVTRCYLDWLSHLPDTHVARKHGVDVAQSLSDEAMHYFNKFKQMTIPDQSIGMLMDWDRQLKLRGINPGTSADLTVATVLAYKLQQWLQMQQVTRYEDRVNLAQQ